MSIKGIIRVLLIFLCVFPLSSGVVNIKGNENLPGPPEQDNSSPWEEMHFRTMKINDSLVQFLVSSELDSVDPFEGPGKYGGHLLFDDDSVTAWVEGQVGHGEGEFIITGLGEGLPLAINIHNGYQKSERLYKLNSRPRVIRLSIYAGIFLEGDQSEISCRYRLKELPQEKYLELDDRMGNQSFEISFPNNNIQCRDSLVRLFKSDFAEELEERQDMCPTCDPEPRLNYFMKIEIRNVYPGTEWDDTCISGISFEYPEERHETIGRSDIILQVYQDKDPASARIYVDTDRKAGIVLVDNTEHPGYVNPGNNENISVVLMAVSPDKEWAQVDFIISGDGQGRAEEYSALYNIRMLRRVDESILDIKYGMFGFVEDSGKIWLDTIDGFVDLEIVREEMRDKLPF
ncbi:MAG: hypothetical protein RQ743_08685 [Bacteroidales bacterium]|nr:hypothetical protein [Bacteroidales bacterium]